MKLRVTVLGSGTSHGVPMIACDCPVCLSTDPRNQRTRCSIAVDNGEQVLLIDTSPDLRLQAVSNYLRRVDAVAFTHAHADHIFGLDDIRRFNEIQGTEIPCFGHRRTLHVISTAFDYIFRPTQIGGGKPNLRLKLVAGPFEAAGMTVTPIPVWHGRVRALGFRIDDFAYITDVSRIPPDSMKLLQGLDTLILGVLRYTPHATHFSVEQGISLIRTLAPRQAFLTHMSHDLDHEATAAALPPGIAPAYDGMVLSIGSGFQVPGS